MSIITKPIMPNHNLNLDDEDDDSGHGNGQPLTLEQVMARLFRALDSVTTTGKTFTMPLVNTPTIPRKIRLKTYYDPKPIPDFRWDWEAYDDSTYNGEGGQVGHGSTEAAAVEDLRQQLYLHNLLTDYEFDNFNELYSIV